MGWTIKWRTWLHLYIGLAKILCECLQVNVTINDKFVLNVLIATVEFVLAPLRGQDQQPARLPDRFKTITGRSRRWW